MSAPACKPLRRRAPQRHAARSQGSDRTDHAAWRNRSFSMDGIAPEPRHRRPGGENHEVRPAGRRAATLPQGWTPRGTPSRMFRSRNGRYRDRGPETRPQRFLPRGAGGVEEMLVVRDHPMACSAIICHSCPVPRRLGISAACRKSKSNSAPSRRRRDRSAPRQRRVRLRHCERATA